MQISEKMNTQFQTKIIEIKLKFKFNLKILSNFHYIHIFYKHETTQCPHSCQCKELALSFMSRPTCIGLRVI